MAQKSVQILPYIDDLVGIGVEDHAEDDFQRLQQVIEYLGLSLALDKTQTPSTSVKWLGIQFDTRKMEMRLPDDKIKDILSLIRSWDKKNTCNKKEVQRLLGSLIFVARVCKPARLFLNRMLKFLRSFQNDNEVKQIQEEFRQDTRWFQSFLPVYNGVALMESKKRDIHLEVDACLSGCGGITNEKYYTVEYHTDILEKNYHISQLELLNVLVALKELCKDESHVKIHVRCDNMSSVCMLQSGKGRDSVMLCIARNIWHWAAQKDIDIIATHVPGVEMTIADALSRNHISQRNLREFVAGCQIRTKFKWIQYHLNSYTNISWSGGKEHTYYLYICIFIY